MDFYLLLTKDLQRGDNPLSFSSSRIILDVCFLWIQKYIYFWFTQQLFAITNEVERSSIAHHVTQCWHTIFGCTIKNPGKITIEKEGGLSFLLAKDKKLRKSLSTKKRKNHCHVNMSHKVLQYKVWQFNPPPHPKNPQAHPRLRFSYCIF